MGEIKSKKCTVCGKDLVGKQKKFCSKACNDKNYQKMNKKPIIYRKCKFCKIQLKGQQRKYCSKKCSAKYYNKKPKKYKDCMFCGKKFTQKNKRHKCCSIICQRKYYYDNKYRKIIRCKNCIICDNELEKNQQKFFCFPTKSFPHTVHFLLFISPIFKILLINFIHWTHY